MTKITLTLIVALAFAGCVTSNTIVQSPDAHQQGYQTEKRDSLNPNTGLGDSALEALSGSYSVPADTQAK